LLKFTMLFEKKECSSKHVLAKEGDPSEYVFLIKSGEFEVVKRVVKQEKLEVSAEQIINN